MIYWFLESALRLVPRVIHLSLKQPSILTEVKQMCDFAMIGTGKYLFWDMRKKISNQVLSRNFLWKISRSLTNNPLNDPRAAVLRIPEVREWRI